jgi:hypothetical protein
VGDFPADEGIFFRHFKRIFSEACPEFESLLLRQQVSDINRENKPLEIVQGLPRVSGRSWATWSPRQRGHQESEISRGLRTFSSVVSQNASLPVAFSANDAVEMPR